MIRPLDVLLRDQAEILSGYREELARVPAVAVLPRPGGASALAAYGRVSAVVTNDPVHGPHLMAVLQAWSGTPPVPSDVAAAEVLCYPAPNHVVGDYAVDEYVRLAAAQGAMIAQKLF